jgi:HlyD family secretion protein
VEETKAALIAAQANLDRWKSELERVADLANRRVVDKQTAEETKNQAAASGSEFQEAKSRFVSAQAKLAESEAKKDAAASEVLAAKARHKADLAETRRLAALRQYENVTAPFDGVVTARMVDTGHLLQANSGPMFIVSRLDPVRLFVEVPEHAAGRIDKGSPCTIRIPSLGGQTLARKVDRTAWSLSPDIRTLRVEMDIPNPDGKIRPGMYSTVIFPIDQTDAVTVPAGAITVLDELNYVYVMEGTKAVRHQVMLGQKEGDSVELLRLRKADGKSAWTAATGKETILTSWEGPITDGATVELK